MTKSTKIITGTFAIALAVVTLVSASSAFAYQGDPSVQGPNFSPERHEAMLKAFDSGDYQAWKDLMGDHGRVAQFINEENFAQFAQAHKLAQEGKLEEAREIRAELGLGMRNGAGKGQGHRRNSGQGNRSGAKDGSGVRGGTSDCFLNN